MNLNHLIKQQNQTKKVMDNLTSFGPLHLVYTGVDEIPYFPKDENGEKSKVQKGFIYTFVNLGNNPASYVMVLDERIENLNILDVFKFEGAGFSYKVTEKNGYKRSYSHWVQHVEYLTKLNSGKNE
ncbi:hypothetical protein JDW15_10125 [Aerococcaceae bacterium zg-ZJ1578]|uniref:hypothetical protein n=1 Tax=Aerococcaceae bacterium zg-252 TaxID=2796928 RepID=UPI001A1E1004|nr:hypothetical protein [Aerococcaceae bacterium zg-1578]MBR7928486.1 hypothetical protein [Aerococcaceae bacterium zg-ZUI334]